jgi:uncharacterized protein YjbI with pentapeptide repeats
MSNATILGFTLFALTSLVSCNDVTVAIGVPPPVSAQEFANFAADPLCATGPSRGEETLTATGATPICPGQTLTASLRVKKTISVPLRIPTRMRTQYCFKDDNGEKHKAELWRTDGDTKVSVLAWAAGSACASATLEPGVYELRVSHERSAEPGAKDESDDTPDIVHTRLYDPNARAEGSTAQTLGSRRLKPLSGKSDFEDPVFELSVNQCPDCKFSFQKWPLLYVDSRGRSHAGYAGDYRNATFYVGTCDADFCEVGGPIPAEQYNFQNAWFTGQFSQQQTVYIGNNLRKNPKLADRFVGAHFGFYGSGVNLVVSNVNGAWIGGSGGTVGSISAGAGPNVSFRATLEFTYGTLQGRINGVETDEATIQALHKTGVVVEGNTVRVHKSDLTGLRVDGTGNRYVFGDADDGVTNVEGFDFRKTTFVNFDFACDRAKGSRFRDSLWQRANLYNVKLRNCNLSKLEGLYQVELRDVDLTNIVWPYGTLWMRGDSYNVDFQGSDLPYLRVVEAYDSPESLAPPALIRGLNFSSVNAPNLRMGRLTSNGPGNRKAAPFRADGLTAVGANFTGAIFDQAELANANFRGAVLDKAVFENAQLQGAKFGDARGSGTSFFQASLLASNFDGSTWEGANFSGTSFSGASFQSARVCGGALTNADLRGANLSGTLIPSKSNIYTRDASSFACDQVTGWDTALTNNVTRCPDGARGACVGPKRWIPPSDISQCCDSFSDPNCPSRQTTGSECEVGCDCESFRCLGKKCG